MLVAELCIKTPAANKLDEQGIHTASEKSNCTPGI